MGNLDNEIADYSDNGLLAPRYHMTKSSSSVKMKPKNEKSLSKLVVLQIFHF